ncbi:MAG: ADP-ribosylglycohydrolase family protein [Opitutae bacterium]|nr:ADP-ribosylglycohydrolase family protein [Opitutae bacterium]
MDELTNKKSGLLFGSYCADALSLGVHWIYDVNELAQKHGRITHYKAPGADSYHPQKQAGDQGHVGDQSLCLLQFLTREKKWDASSFMDDWLGMWADYNDYIDGATKSTLENVKNQSDKTQGGSDSVEIAGPARIAPLIVYLTNSSEEEVVRASVEQTVLTHRSQEAEESATFLAKAGYRLMHGASLLDTLNETAPEWALKKANSVLSQNTMDAIGQLGPACSISSALPSVLYLALKYGDNTETAFIENAMAGGDNCARGLALGILLGAANGISSIPERWVNELNAHDLLREFSQI